MSNPLYSILQSQSTNKLSGFIQKLNQLKSSFNGDPMAQIQRMLNSGQITQDQYNKAVQQAQQIQRMLGQ